MPKEFNPVPKEFTYKEKNFTPPEVNSTKFFMQKKADVFRPLRYEKISSIFKCMSDGSAEMGITTVQETMKPRDPQREARKNVTEHIEPHDPLDEAKLQREQDEFGENIEDLLAKLKAEGKSDLQIMDHDELEDALGVTLTNERHGGTKHVYDVEERPDVVAKVDRLYVEPEDQDIEQDLNEFLHAFAPDQIPETVETKQAEKNGKKASLTYTKKVTIAPEGTKAAPGKTIEDLKARFRAVGLHRFVDTNIGNGVTETNHDVNAMTGAEVYYDDSGDLIIADPLQQRDMIERYVDKNIGTIYTEQSAQKVKDVLENMQKKHDPDYKINPEYKAQKENQKTLVAAA